MLITYDFNLSNLFQGPDKDKPGQIDYERPEQDIFRDLVTLLKAKSSRFAEMIEKQVGRERISSRCWIIVSASDK